MSCFNSNEFEDCFVKNVAVFLLAQFCDSFREKGRSRNVSFSEMFFENFQRSHNFYLPQPLAKSIQYAFVYKKI